MSIIKGIIADEVWRDVFGYEGCYQVSNLGNVKSLPNQRRKTELILKCAKKPPTGYLVVNLSKNGIAKTHHVHELVLRAFVGERPSGFVACHCNGDAANNSVENLRWDTQLSNIADKVIHGTAQFGESNSMAKFSAETITEVKLALKERQYRGAISEIAREFGLLPQTVSKIKNGIRWAHLEVAV